MLIHNGLRVLRSIMTSDFHNGDKKICALWEAHTKRNGMTPLKKKETTLLVSMTGDQCLFLLPNIQLSEGLTVLCTQRVRIVGGYWTPLRIAEYAELAGLRLRGLDRFEAHYERLRKAKAQKRETDPLSDYVILR